MKILFRRTTSLYQIRLNTDIFLPSIFFAKSAPQTHTLWSAPAERSGDGALAHPGRSVDTKAVSHFVCHRTPYFPVRQQDGVRPSPGAGSYDWHAGLEITRVAGIAAPEDERAPVYQIHSIFSNRLLYTIRTRN
jgi:hypothetical protein